MKKLVMVVAFILGAICFSTFAFAADPVDLRDKKGVVDPKDLKKDDPKEPSLRTKEPPPPEKKTENKQYEVKKSGDTTEHHFAP